MPTINVTRTYLQLSHPDDLRREGCDLPEGYTITERQSCSVELYRWLYRTVGEAWHWVDRLAWSDAEMEAYLSQTDVRVFTLDHQEDIAGYFELKAHEDGSTEIAYFGLAPDFIGGGLGKALLVSAADTAWKLGAKRVWLHTCTLDHPAALTNYQKRGFHPYKTETYQISPNIHSHSLME